MLKTHFSGNNTIWGVHYPRMPPRGYGHGVNLNLLFVFNEILKRRLPALYCVYLFLLFIIRYHFVTPLTSIVVLRSDDRKRIEKALREEEEQRVKEEAARAEVKREETEKTKDVASALADAKPVPHRYSSAVRGDRGGFYGDPHFVIPLTDDIRLCFNWDGNDGEVTYFLTRGTFRF